MQKITILAGAIVIAIALAFLYLTIQGLISFSISPDYYHNFRFLSLPYDATSTISDQEKIISIAFSSAWWLGIIVGIAVGLTSMIYGRYDKIKAAIRDGFLVIFCTVTLINIIVFALGKFYWYKTDTTWISTDYIADRSSLVAVGSMDEFILPITISGLVLAIVYMIVKKAQRG